MPFAPLLFAAQTAVASFGSNPGALQMYEHVPAGLPAGAPLVVVLHGCTQTAAAMEAAGWDALADDYGFAVAYAQQQSANNAEDCFNWYDGATDDARGAGEAASVAQMVDYEVSAHGVDPAKVYVAGFSAGGAFAAVMAATYPDKFAAASIMSGVPFGCATQLADAVTCTNPGVTKTADQWGALVRAAYSASTYPRVQIWQGSADTTVAPMNAGELAKQWTDADGVALTATATEMVGQATRTAYGSGVQPTVETWIVGGMDHAVALGTDGAIPCPGTTATYFEDRGVCSTVHAAQFFGIVPAGSGDGSGSGSDGSGDGSGSDGGSGSGGSGSGGNGESGAGNGGGCAATEDAGGAGALALAIAGIGLARQRRRAMRQVLASRHDEG